MYATKEQERAALEKIRKIVAELGEDSYIGIAFDGCFEMAEQNIENDFACSMKAARDGALEREELAKAREQIALKTIESQRAHLEHLQTTMLTLPDLEAVRAVCKHHSVEEQKKTRDLAERVVELAEQPESVAFKDAVAAHRRQKKLVEAYDELTGRIDTAIRNHYDTK